MASESDGDIVRFSSMRQPPLIKQLKGILSEYPDGGQILKELIQNAEDAGATVVDIEYDKRRINDISSETTPAYTKFFKGPALCVYNDAVFTEEDWEGIRMIYSSVKEEDPLKVGRFGLGFKSVFHITDYPCVISGDKLLMIDPQQQSDKVNAMVSLNDIERLDNSQLPIEVFWQAMSDKFGLTHENIQKGYFKGTIFRFPLREKTSQLSETLYDEEKVLGLYDDFRSDTSSILVFLKNLGKIQLNITNEESSETVAFVEILDENNEVKNSRSKFRRRLEGVTREYQGDDIVHEAQMTIRTWTKGTLNITKWMVVNYYVGNSASPAFRKLIEDENLGYSPYVGVARPLNQEDGDCFEGHIFCFLPLPKEGSKLTGLPVHVNGYFALSQNRHHLKQETDEQRGKRIDDKSILWNQHLIKEAIPKAYCRLILYAIGISNNSANTVSTTRAVYDCWPIKTKTLSRWKTVESELYMKMKTLKVFYSDHSGSWISVTKSCFATFSSLPGDYEHIKTAVKRCMKKVGLNHVDIPVEVFDTVRCYITQVQDITPELLACYMHKYHAYKDLSSAEKADVLMYLLSDQKSHHLLHGIELLPVASGEWSTFNNRGHDVYLCNEEVIDILYGMEKYLVQKQSEIGDVLFSRISQLCDQDFCQIKLLSDDKMVHIVKEILDRLLGSKKCITKQSQISVAWLQRLWNYILTTHNVSKFVHVTIFPKLTKGTWDNPEEIALLKLSDKILVRSSFTDSLPDGVVRCFEKMGVTSVDMLPAWLAKDKLKHFLFWPSYKGIVKLLEVIFDSHDWKEMIQMFHKTSTGAEKKALVAFLAKYSRSLSDKSIELIQHLPLFPGVKKIEGASTYLSVKQTREFISEDIDFPKNVALSFTCLLSDSENNGLIKAIGGHVMDLNEIVTAKLERISKQQEDVLKFMEFVVDRFHLFQRNNDIIRLSSKVPFLRSGNRRCCPSELFDPSDPLLVDLLHDEFLLPETKKPLSQEKLSILRILGLQSVDQIDQAVILEVAKKLDTWSKSRRQNDNYVKKAYALKDFLQRYPSLLQQSSFVARIKQLECFPTESKRDAKYPQSLPWYHPKNFLAKPEIIKDVSMSLLVGSVQPTISCSSELMISKFGWLTPPEILTVLQQLRTVKQTYSVNIRPDIMASLKELYCHLANRIMDVRAAGQYLNGEEIMWTGNGFVAADKVTIKKSQMDLDLSPYVYCLPTDFQSCSKLFYEFGCRDSQSEIVLLDALQLIQATHSVTQEEHVVVRDKRLVCNILDRIAQLKKKGFDIDTEQIPMMVHDSDKSVLKLFPLSECVYDDDPEYAFEDTGNKHLVHEMICNDTAATLGVVSITRKTLQDAEGLGIEACGQQEPLTTRLSSLLREGYTDGLSVPKELIQNADDAGATVIKFLYDERQNLDARQRVFTRGMKEFQGPALWVYNDAQFSKEDFRNITKLNGATKQSDVNKIGKFGLGFCSVYNLTDIPSFLSGKNLVLFDPHETHLKNILSGSNTGLKYDLPNKTLISRHADQFKPYTGIFGCNIADENFSLYKGTLFRLPLRTDKQARESKISSKAYTDDEMKELLRMLVTNAGNLLLFSQNVKSIEIYHLPDGKSVQDITFLYSQHKASFRIDRRIQSELNESVLSRMPEILCNNQNFTETHISVMKQTLQPIARKLIPRLNNVKDNYETPWLIAWATGCGSSLNLYKRLSSEGAVPLAAVSVPCLSREYIRPLPIDASLPSGFYHRSHIFCFLPLPVTTDLKMHVNGCFAVTSDRRQLLTLSEDDKTNPRHSWNKCLMQDSLVAAFVTLLRSIAENDVDEMYDMYSLWPTDCDHLTAPFEATFYRDLISKQLVIFKGHGELLPFGSICFLDPALRKSDLGNIAMEFVATFWSKHDHGTLIDIPEHVIKNIRKYNKAYEKLIRSKEITSNIMCKLFLKHIDDQFWKTRKLDQYRFIIYALNCYDPEITSLMKKMNCIPTEPSHRLRKPAELINPGSLIAGLFDNQEEVFPINDQGFRQPTILCKLIEMGMIDNFLPNSLLCDRCSSVEKLAESCCACACTRIQNILHYMTQRRVLECLKESDSAVAISDVSFLPVLPKPGKWAFSWKAESDCSVKRFVGNHCQNHSEVDRKHCKLLILGKPCEVFRRDTTEYLGTVGLILDEDLIYGDNLTTFRYNELFSFLSIKTSAQIPVTLCVEQILNLSKEYRSKDTQLHELQQLHGKLFTYFETKAEKLDKADLSSLNALADSPVILIGDELLEPRKVAFEVAHECKPYLYKLPKIEALTKSHIYATIGVKNHFNLEVLIGAFEEAGCIAGRQMDISLVINLLSNLRDSLERENKSYKEMTQYHDRILAPDADGILWPTKDLVIENPDFQSNIAMKILHSSVAPQLGKDLGVTVKTLKCYKSIAFAVSFGQHENLVTRIQGLLRAYPCDSSIMKELLQNADDAGATEIYFIKDYRQHACNQLFSDTCIPLQGPSICVYNNSYFTQKDIQGIHNLGTGSKRDDPTRTGQYGVGFNAVYHLTDTPSFVTIGPETSKGGDLFIFDPLLTHVPEATVAEPGMRCKVTDVCLNFPEHLLGFSMQDFISNEKGTIFRFPLRCSTSDISSTVLNEATMNSILFDFKKDMMEAILFLKNISCIKIIDITSGKIVEEYAVRLQGQNDNEMDERKQFNETILHKTSELMGSKDELLNISPMQNIYTVNITDSVTVSNSWIIAQQFGVCSSNEKHNDIAKHIRSGDLGLLPYGGVAIPFDTTQKPSLTSFAGKAFCILPLPLETGLPVHINGHFALDHEARRELWKDGFRGDWNKFLAESVIIPAWVAGLKHACKLLSPVIELANTVASMNHLCDSYYKLLPVPGETKAEFWKHISVQFYQHVVNNRQDIFLTVHKKHVADKNFIIEWTIVNPSDDRSFYGVFDSIYHHLPAYDFRLRDKMYRTIALLLKNFGLKLLQMPLKNKQAIDDAGIKSLRSADPKTVVSFLKTMNDYHGENCGIGGIDVDISETKFGTPENLQILATYIALDPENYQMLEGLPVLLTSDEVLRVCSADHAVYVSQYAQLLPASWDLFLHDSVCKAFTDHTKLSSSPGFKLFEFQDFVKLLPESKAASVFGSGLDVPWSDSQYTSDCLHVTSDWLAMFYGFLCQQSKKEIKSSNKAVNFPALKISTKKLTCNMDKLSQWSFLLCKIAGENKLIPFRKRGHVIHLSEKQKHDAFGKILNKLPIPQLDTHTCQLENDIKQAIIKCVPNLERPYPLLKCLVSHADSIDLSRTLSAGDGIEILSYFLRHIETLKKDDDNLQSLLKHLPFYVTKQGTMTAIDTCKNAIVVPKEMPMNGIQEWADSCNIILLQDNDTLAELHQYLNLQRASIIQIYQKEILPSIRYLPREHLVTHIVFLRDILYGMAAYQQEQKQIFTALKNIPFITVDGVLRTANDLYDPNNSVFKLLLSRNNFIPDEFLTDSWAPFLDKLGLIREVDDKSLIEFARKIEMQGRDSITTNVKEKSDALLICFLQREWDNTTLTQLRSIRFIVPYRVDSEQSQIVQPLNDGRYLICFKDSVSSAKSHLCWSSASLIPSEVISKIGRNSIECLGICEDPPLSSVVRHCQSAIPYLSENIRDMDSNLTKHLMSSFYEYFRAYGDRDPDLMSQLAGLPIIHIPDEKVMTPSSQVVIELESYLEIKPYLYKAPVFYGQYHELFQMLGCKKQCTYFHCINVLEKVKLACGDRVLSLPERKQARRALKGLLSLEFGEECDGIVYLPNEKMELKRASELIFSDNAWYDYRLRNIIEIDYFAGTSFFNPPEKSYETVFRTWPTHMRPVFLSSIVEEECCLNDASSAIPRSILARTIETFLRSAELVTALARLLKHQLSSRSDAASEVDLVSFENSTRECLCRINIVAMSELRTILKFRGDISPCSELDIQYFIKTSANDNGQPIDFFFKENSSRQIDNSSVTEGLQRLIQMSTKYQLHAKSSSLITSLIQSMDSPQMLHEILDRNQISAHDSAGSMRREYFPRPGTYVETDLIPFLEQGIVPFKEHEFDEVAMEVDDSVDDEDSSNFIYVRIRGIEERTEYQNHNISGNMAIIYLVNTRNGTPPERVPIYRLYRFVRRDVSSSLELEIVDSNAESPSNFPFDEQCRNPTTNLPFDEQCRLIRQELINAWKLPGSDRKKVVRRIMLKWHPDKNRGNEEYCTEVFKYIQIIISRLENGESLEEDVYEEMSRGASSFSSSSANFYENVNRRARAYASAYYDNYDEYSRSGGSGPYSHSSRTVYKRQDIPEANRWFRQATHDFHTATACFAAVEDTKSYNWICNMCLHACENALRAALFFKGENVEIFIRINGVMDVPAATPELREQALRIERRIGDHARLTLPDTISRPRIPHEILTKADAEFALEVTSEILRLVSEYIT